MINRTDRPPILGGKPIFDQTLKLVQPLSPKLSEISNDLIRILSSGTLTNNGPHVMKFEEEMAQYLHVKHCIAVANGTLAIMLVLKALDLKGEAILPSFTFAATAEAVSWCGLGLKFTDIAPSTYTIDPQSVAKAIDAKTSVIIGVHIFGNPCDVGTLTDLAKKNKLKLIFDAAHAMGSCRRGRPVATFGDAEIFSFHASKILATGEGGAITTNNDKLAKRLAALRNFGDVGKFNYRYIGLNAKLAEIPALLGRYGLRHLTDAIELRKQLAESYRKKLNHIPGISFQTIHPDDTINHQYFPIMIDKKIFGFGAGELAMLLEQERIETRRYFYPPVHKYFCYRMQSKSACLPVTEDISRRTICLPLYSNMNMSHVDGVCRAMERIWRFRNDIWQKGLFL